MRSASANPALVTSTTGSPLRVSSALVATVVPPLTAATARGAAPAAARIARTARKPGSSAAPPALAEGTLRDRKSTRLNSSHSQISYAVFCLKKKKKERQLRIIIASDH